MGKSASKPAADKDEEEFDPFLGLLLGDTWWRLGRNVAKVRNVEGATRAKNLEEWARIVRSELDESGMNEPVGGITSQALMTFVDTVLGVLERKYEGKSIAATVRRLTKKANAFNVYDDGQYLDIQEPADVFWAVEYDFLFSKLDKAIAGGGWLNGVGRCADPECDAFFVKSRSDQRHHTGACRTRAANRKAYGQHVGQRAHTRRGRPRIRN